MTEYVRIVNFTIVGFLDSPTPPADAGWFPIVTTPRPPDPATTTQDLSYAVVGGKPVEVWTARPKTEGEVAKDADAVAAGNATTLQARALAAIETNQAFLALSAPTNAQTLAQVRALTKEATALIRLTTRALSTIDGS